MNLAKIPKVGSIFGGRNRHPFTTTQLLQPHKRRIWDARCGGSGNVKDGGRGMAQSFWSASFPKRRIWDAASRYLHMHMSEEGVQLDSETSQN